MTSEGVDGLKGVSEMNSWNRGFRGLWPGRGAGVAGVSLVELLCVIAIIGVLASLLLGPVGRALGKARRLKSEIEVPAHLERLQTGMRRFAEAHAEYQCPDLEALLLFAQPGGPTERWLKQGLQNRSVRFTPFSHATPDATIVVDITMPNGKGRTLYGVSKGDLTRTPE